ncbi:MAG: DUF493 domain-containing protein [Gammaproteobacteria bacterium]|nr:DUF493 domain-containing protein [Gammaproteobacteria bacterium]MDH5729642.1 DUF493 domain-containing protein [Gammaproteobacteria bacterium]
MKTTDEDSVFQFPCEFPIKVMGLDHPDFHPVILDIFQRHVPDFDGACISTRPSKGGKYLAFTITIMAQNKQQLDDIYMELSAHERVIMAL